MQNLKKTLSLVLCFAMMFTTLCFFPLTGAVTRAEAAVVNTGNESVFHVPETIYLYPEVTSWKSSSATPFQYYVNNTVNTADIYAAPAVEPNLDGEGRLYAAAKEGMSDVSLTVKFVNLDGSYMAEADYGTVSYEIEEQDGYYLIRVTGGVSPVLAASVNGCYIEWGLTYKNDKGETKALFNYTYIYKPYVVPYGAAAKVYSKKGDVNVYGQQITWITGVHSINATAAQTNTRYPRYMPLASETATTFAFSPFLSKDNVAYAGGVQVSGAAPVKNGTYNAVFSGTDPATSYFHAGQTGAGLDSSEKALAWFYGASTDNTYPVAFDYYTFTETQGVQYALSHVSPTRTGAITVDVSRYDNLNQIPNLGVGMMVVDVDFVDALYNSPYIPISQWYIADATGKTAYSTAEYSDYNTFSAIRNSAVIKFAKEEDLQTALSKGITYAGSWLREIDDTVAEKTYTIHSYYESKDREGDYQAASASIDLTVKQVDKTNLREAVNRATSYMSTLGVKENWNSYYYDVNAIDPDTGVSAWRRFQTAYIYACGALGNIDTELPVTYDEYAAELNASLDALLSGKGLRVYFDVNYDDIGVNLWIPLTEKLGASDLAYIWDEANEAVIINGTDTNGSNFGFFPFTPTSTAPYTFSMDVVSGTFGVGDYAGCTVIEPTDINNNFSFEGGVRYNFDNYFGNSVQRAFSYAENHFGDIEKIYFRTYHASGFDPLVADRFTVRLKIEEGSAKTAYSPAGKVVTGTTYEKLPVPTREGYSFGGWYTDDTLTTRVTEASDVSARILYAKWVPNAYSISYDNMISINEWVNYGNSANTVDAAGNGPVEYDPSTVSVKITSAAKKGECYTVWDTSAYSVPVKPDTSYRFSYTVSGHNGIGQHQAFMFIYANGSTVGFADGVGWADVNKYASGDGEYYIDFKTGSQAEELRFRIGTNNGTDESVTVTFSDIRLCEKTDYNLGLNISATESTAIFDAESYGELATATRDGYVFDGWYTADGEKITADTPVKSENIHVYSSWVPNHYSIAFDGNTGLGGLGIANVVYDQPFKLPPNYFIKTGYTFIGWSTSPDGEVMYTDEEEVSNLTTVVNGSVTLYAIWKANEFTVKPDKNGGEGTMSNITVTYDSEALLPECGFDRTGYTFIGWSTDPDGTSILTDAEYDNLCTENGDEITLYAIWSENTYTLTFDKNGGEGENIPATRYGYEEDVVLPLNVFTKTGYVLSGWSLEKDGEVVYTNGQTVKHINSDKNGTVTLYAVWTPVNYTVKFDGNTDSGSMADIPMVYDISVTLPANTFTKEGYHFIGWATSADGDVKYSDKASVKNLVATEGKSVTLYAVWEINVYKVTFSYRNSAGTLVTNTVNVKHGETAVVPSDFTLTPYKDETQHYVFSKWSSDITNITSDITVNAQYPSGAAEAHDIATTTVDSTCTSTGYVRNYCTACTYAVETTIALKSHQWDEGTVELEPGCTTTGTRVYSCANCSNKRSEVIDPTKHSFVDFPAKAATCAEEGNIAHKHCENCSKCFSTDAPDTAADSEALTEAQVKISKLPHTPGAEATCTTPQTCTECSAVITAALGHNEVTEYITTEATCTTAGTVIVKVTCTACDYENSTTEYRTVPHSYVEKVTEPTCTTKGYTTYTCSVCGDNYTDNEVPEKGHTEGIWVTTTEPDCTNPGIKTNYCAVCSEAHATRVVEAEGHDEGEWKTVTPAKCEEWGEDALCCTKCGTVINHRGTPPKGHGDEREEITVYPGCESAGKRSTFCVDCNEELSFEILDALGHTPDGPAACEKDSVCTVCNEILENRFGHDWDEGVITREPTETLVGIKTYTCNNDKNHTYTEEIPVRIVITLPADVDFDADENGYIGNIHSMIKVEDGLSYTVSVDASSVVTMDENGNMTASDDGTADITVETEDGHKKTFTITVRTLKTVTFDVRGHLTTVKAYVGDKVTAPEVGSYTENGFLYRFKTWTLNGAPVTVLTVTGEMTFVAIFTSSCDYSVLDRLTKIFNSSVDGSYNNADKIKLYKSEIENAKKLIAEFAEGRDVRDASEQPSVDAAADVLSALISKLYPDDQGRLFIDAEDSVELGSITEFTVFLIPINSVVTDGIWTSSDESIGFFIGSSFYAVKTGTVTVTVTSGVRSASKEIVVTSGSSAARVIMFDTLLSNVNYIVENSYIIRTTTNIFWATDAPIHFRIVDDGTFETYIVYLNDEVVLPNGDGIYTIPANIGDVHVKVEGMVLNPDDNNGGKISFWQMIINFFKSIADFFKNLFG